LNMPLVTCFFVAHSIGSFQVKAPALVGCVFLFEAISNFLSIWYGFFVAKGSSMLFPTSFSAQEWGGSFDVLWRLPVTMPGWWSASKGVFVGILLGLIVAFWRSSFLKVFIAKGKQGVQGLLTKVFSPMIPLFVLGFFARNYHSSVFDGLWKQYGPPMAFLVMALGLYIVFLFWMAAGFSVAQTVKKIKNLLPAGIVAFTSGCSLSTMPITIKGVEKNLKDPSLASALIPMTTNIQQIADCIVNAFLCFLIYEMVYHKQPSLELWVVFSFVFALARFATAAIMGGAIFIMIPLYEKYLSFDAEMIATIWAFNVVLDPFVTSGNVMANGALCNVFERVWSPLAHWFAKRSLGKPV
jgi:Na+/H+-dicarboxylate symporter